MADQFAIVTRYRSPSGRIIRHIYVQSDGTPYPTRARARTALNRMWRRAEANYSVLERQNMEGDVVKILAGRP